MYMESKEKWVLIESVDWDANQPGGQRVKGKTKPLVLKKPGASNKALKKFKTGTIFDDALLTVVLNLPECTERWEQARVELKNLDLHCFLKFKAIKGADMIKGVEPEGHFWKVTLNEKGKETLTDVTGDTVMVRCRNRTQVAGCLGCTWSA